MFKPHRFVPKSAVAAALAATGMAAHATTPFVVQDIRIDGLQRIEPGSVFAYLPIKQGDTFTDDKASAAIRALSDAGDALLVTVEDASQHVRIWVDSKGSQE